MCIFVGLTDFVKRDALTLVDEISRTEITTIIIIIITIIVTIIAITISHMFIAYT